MNKVQTKIAGVEDLDELMELRKEFIETEFGTSKNRDLKTFYQNTENILCSIGKFRVVVGVKLFIAQIVLHDEGGRLLAHITVMPRLIADASNFTFPGGIAENEAIFIAVGHEPLLDRRVLLLLVQ